MQRFSRFLRILIFIVMIFQSLYLVLGLVKVKVYHGGMSAVLVCCRGHKDTIRLVLIMVKVGICVILAVVVVVIVVVVVVVVAVVVVVMVVVFGG